MAIKTQISANEATAPFQCESGWANTNILLNLNKAALDTLDRIGYGLVEKYRLAGMTSNRVRMMALAHVLDNAL